MKKISKFLVLSTTFLVINNTFAASTYVGLDDIGYSCHVILGSIGEHAMLSTPDRKDSIFLVKDIEQINSNVVLYKDNTRDNEQFVEKRLRVSYNGNKVFKVILQERKYFDDGGDAGLFNNVKVCLFQ